MSAGEREAQIVEAAIAVLAETGVPGMTLRAVAQQAGIPLGTLHYAFPAKDTLLRSVISKVVDDISEVLRTGIERDKGLEHALRRGITNFWNELVDTGIGLQILQYELTTYALRTEGPALARFQYDRYSSLVTQFCEQAATAAGERCAVGFDTLGRIALAQVDGLILQYLANPDLDRAHRDLSHAIDMLVLFADPQPVKRKRRTAAASPSD